MSDERQVAKKIPTIPSPKGPFVRVHRVCTFTTLPCDWDDDFSLGQVAKKGCSYLWHTGGLRH
jgi:hypothetical protein